MGALHRNSCCASVLDCCIVAGDQRRVHFGSRRREVSRSSRSTYIDNKCTADACKITRWTAVTAVDVLLELSLIALASFLFSTLQMSRKQKVVVIAGFCFRIGYLHFFH